MVNMLLMMSYGPTLTHHEFGILQSQVLSSASRLSK